jgi:hypothetical protein
VLQGHSVPSFVASETHPLGSQTWFRFFNGRCGSPAAFPITALFFFESKTAGLMFVRHYWLQGFRWCLFSWFSAEDAAADHECGDNCPESPKLHLLHCGVSVANTTRSHYKLTDVSSLAQQLRQLRHIGRDLPGLSRNFYNDAGACLRLSSDKPILKAFCRVAPSVRFKARAIFAAWVLLRASLFNLRISSVVHARLLFSLV